MVVDQFKNENDEDEGGNDVQIIENQDIKNKHFHYYVDSTGNNHRLIKLILNKRPFLKYTKNVDKFDEVSLIWTQWSKQLIHR